METSTGDLFCDTDVSPDDVWGDPVICAEPATQNPAPALPPKRLRPEYPAPSAATGGEGLRISYDMAPRDNGGPLAPLEIQEIRGEVVRLEPEEPAVSRMPRHVAFHERPAHAPDPAAASGEATDWGRAKRQPVIWILGIGMAVAATVVGAMVMLPFVNKSNAARPPLPGQSEWVLEAVTEADAISEMLSRKAEAERVFQDFISAPSPEAIPPLIRDPEKIDGLIREMRHPAGAFANRPPPKTRNWIVRETPLIRYGILTGILPDHSNFEAYFTLAQGRLVMDWKASTAYGTAGFAELAQKQGNPAEIRTMILPSDFYTLAFPEGAYQNYQMVSPDQRESIWAYSRRGTDVHEALKLLLNSGEIITDETEPVKVTVRLEPGPANSLPGQWQIVELLHKDWIAP